MERPYDQFWSTIQCIVYMHEENEPTEPITWTIMVERYIPTAPHYSYYTSQFCYLSSMAFLSPWKNFAALWYSLHWLNYGSCGRGRQKVGQISDLGNVLFLSLTYRDIFADPVCDVRNNSEGFLIFWRKICVNFYDRKKLKKPSPNNTADSDSHNYYPHTAT